MSDLNSIVVGHLEARRRHFTRREMLGLAAGGLAGLALPGTASAARLPIGAARWFDQTKGMWPVRVGNEVVELIDGPETFAAMVAAIQTATGSGTRGGHHFIYLLGWTLHSDFDLIPGTPGTSIQSLLAQASTGGVEVRAMIWASPPALGRDNAIAVEFINSAQVPTGGAILDDRVVFFIPKLTSHHQKVLLVNGERGLFAFCGGVDINPDRIHPVTESPGSPYHDVQCRIRGPAAGDLLQVFIERWTDHPDVAGLPPARQGLRGIGLTGPNHVARARATVQIGRTYASGASIGQVPPSIVAEMQEVYDQLQKEQPFLPTGAVNPGDLGDGYVFAPFGSVQVARMLVRAIAETRHFIYIEDQFFVDTAPNDAGLNVVDALVSALPRLDNLTVLVTHPDLFILPQKRYRRRLLIDALRAKGRRKVRVFERTPIDAPHSYVHSKAWIFDDQFAIIGSANLNRRSWTNDSEAVAGIYDPPSWLGPGVPQRLRMRLWAEHLNVPPRFLRNGAASARLWLNPPAGAEIAPYDPSPLDDEPIHSDREWFLVDPDGSGDGLGPFASP